MVEKHSKDEALSLLFRQEGQQIRDIKFFVGNADSKTDDGIWEQVHSALIQERMGTATITTAFEDDAVLVEAVEFLNSL